MKPMIKDSAVSPGRQFVPAVRGLMQLVCVLLAAGLCSAQTTTTVTLTFEGLQNNEYINNYYNGGYGLLPDPNTGAPGVQGSGPGPNYGITFGLNSQAIQSTSTGGSGNFTANPSGNTIAYFLTGPGVVMNVPAGFTTGFSFYYAGFQSGSVTVYDGLNGSGNVLATINLPQNVFTSNCPTGADGLLACNWSQSNNAFTGVAKSVNFSGAANEIGFDNITLGSATVTTPLTITNTSPLTPGSVGLAYNAALTATGGTTPYTWSATGLPPGLSVNGSAITGTPTLAGSYSVTLTVKDSSSPVQTVTTKQPLTLVISPPIFSVTNTSPLPSGTVNVSYTAALTENGGTAPYTWTASGLPPGLSVSGSAITGTPTTVGSYSVSLTVKDSSSPVQTATTSQPLTLVIKAAALTITNTSFVSGTVGIGYSAALTATGGTTPYTWSATGLPPGLSVNGSAITGTPTAVGSSSVTLTVKDSSSPVQTATTQQPLTLVINAAKVTITNTALPSGTINAGYNAPLTATGGTTPYTWSATGLPPGLSVNGSAITGTPTTAGTSQVTLTVKDSSSPALTATTPALNLLVNGQLLLTCSTTVGPAFQGASYADICTASGGTQGYTFTLSSGSLPAGLAPTVTGTSYSIGGKLTGTGAYSYTVQVRDAAGATQSQAFSGTIAPLPSVSAFSLTAVASAANQYTASLQFTSAPPVALTGSVCLTFKPDPGVTGASSYQSQEVQFANGVTNSSCSSSPHNTLSFTVPAQGSAVTWAGNSSQFSQGTVAGTISVTLTSLTDPGGNSVLPSSGLSSTVSIAAAQPVITNTPSFTTTSSTITVTFDAVTSKRELAGVNYTFNSSGTPIPISISFSSGTFAGMDQTLWFGTAPSLATGGAFSLTSTFSCTNCSSITGVQVTASN